MAQVTPLSQCMVGSDGNSNSSNFKAFMRVLVTYKNVNGQIKDENARRATTHQFFRLSRAAYSTIRDSTWQKRIQAFIAVLSLLHVPARMKKIPSKMEALKWSQKFTSIFKMLKL